MFNHIEDAINWIQEQTKFRSHGSLEVINLAYPLLEINLDQIKKIHIAGTNGKGSVASFVSHVLMEAGFKVGTFTSPYLVTFNERIRINFELISDQKLLEIINQIYRLNETLKLKHQVSLSFFECLTLASLLYFSIEQVDYIVMEVGIGGLYDATNILNYDVSLITNIGFDHMKQLGDTLEAIADNKLGILKPRGVLITTVDKALKNHFKKYADKQKAKIKFVKERDIFALSKHAFSYQSETFEIPLLGDYQRLNAALAIEAMRYFNLSDEVIKRGLLRASWPGRLEQIGSHNVYIDGAHNIDAMIALKRNIKYLFHRKRIIILLSILGDKDIQKMIDIIKDDQTEIILTSFEDFRYRDLAVFANEQIKFIKDAKKAYQDIVSSLGDDILIITGSIHFIGYMKKIIK